MRPRLTMRALHMFSLYYVVLNLRIAPPTVRSDPLRRVTGMNALERRVSNDICRYLRMLSKVFTI